MSKLEPGCESCRLISERDLGRAPLWDCILRRDYFDVVHVQSGSLPGWIVLVVRRHISAIDELTEKESLELGDLLRRVSLGLKEITGCEKTYVMQFAEAPGHNHVHFHVVPKASDMPERRLPFSGRVQGQAARGVRFPAPGGGSMDTQRHIG